MKAICTLLIVACCIVKVSAQTLPGTANQIPGLKIEQHSGLDTNLTWHLPKTPDALKQMPNLQFYNKATVNLSTDALIVYSTMPVVRPTGVSKMPVASLSSEGYNMPVKRFVLVDPSASSSNP